MNTHTKGQLAELKVQQRAVEKCYLVSKPIYDGGRYDLIIDDGQKLWRVQVKYADGGASHCEGAVTVGLEKRRKDGNLLYTSDEIDLLLVYLPKKELVLSFPAEKFHQKTGIQIRLELPKNHQKNGVNFYQDFIW